MSPFRPLVAFVILLVAFAGSACSPADPRSRIDTALATLRSDAGGAAKAKACAEIRSALAEYRHDAPDRDALVGRAVPLLVAALREPLAQVSAQDALIAIGLPAYDALFDAALAEDEATQEGAVVCLVRMSATAIPVLMPELLGDDVAAQDRAARVLIRVGAPGSATLRETHRQILEPFAATSDPTEAAQLSTRARTGLLAFIQVFSAIGDRTSVQSLLDGCEAVYRAYPQLGTAYLRAIQDMGPGALDRLPAEQRLAYERLRLLLDAR